MTSLTGVSIKGDIWTQRQTHTEATWRACQVCQPRTAGLRVTPGARSGREEICSGAPLTPRFWTSGSRAVRPAFLWFSHQLVLGQPQDTGGPHPIPAAGPVGGGRVRTGAQESGCRSRALCGSRHGPTPAPETAQSVCSGCYRPQADLGQKHSIC